MKIYYPQNIIASYDGGCMIAGFSFESNINSTGTYNYEPDVFLLKFFADGTLSVPNTTTGISFRPYTFFPNPVGDVLQMEYSPDVTPVLLELLDLQGRLVLSQQNNLETLNMDGLPAGTYTLRLTLNKGKAFSEKVVKL